jgi:hypothetical protein
MFEPCHDNKQALVFSFLLVVRLEGLAFDQSDPVIPADI